MGKRRLHNRECRDRIRFAAMHSKSRLRVEIASCGHVLAGVWAAMGPIRETPTCFARAVRSGLSATPQPQTSVQITTLSIGTWKIRKFHHIALSSVELLLRYSLLSPEMLRCFASCSYEGEVLDKRRGNHFGGLSCEDSISLVSE
jgi:hypothetical protein